MHASRNSRRKNDVTGSDARQSNMCLESGVGKIANDSLQLKMMITAGQS